MSAPRSATATASSPLRTWRPRAEWLLALAGCAAPREDVDLAGAAFGGAWHARVVADPARAPALQAAIEARLAALDSALSTWRPDSELSRWNASPTGGPVSADLGAALLAARDVGEASGGVFDVTLDPLIVAWGFDRGGPRTTAPSAAEIAAAKAHTGLDRVRIRPGRADKVDPEVRVNLGGIAAGYAVDALGDVLRAEGVTDASIELTGEVRAWGRSATGRPWRVGVQWPERGSDARLFAVALEDRALTTAGTYERWFEVDGHRYGHILDPRTGAPVAGDVVSVTVVAPDATTADGFDTALLILGSAAGMRPGVEAAFVRQGADGALTIEVTPGFPPLVDPAVPVRVLGL